MALKYTTAELHQCFAEYIYDEVNSSNYAQFSVMNDVQLILEYSGNHQWDGWRIAWIITGAAV